MRRAFGRRDIGVGDITLAVVLSFGAITSTSGWHGTPSPHDGVVASLAVLLMTAPVAFARRQPLAAAATLAIGVMLNWLLIGDMVRCGAGLPAAFYVAFMVGNRCRRRREVIGGTALVVANIVIQAYSDPHLGAGVIVYMAPIAVGFMIAGQLLRARNAAVASLRDRTAELRVQREQNAQLAVAADQARIAGDLDDFLHDRVGQIAAAAKAGRDTLDTEPARAAGAFVAIQDTGRETLTHMRGVVANLKDQAPTHPQPVLAQLGRLLSQATVAGAQLEVIGDPRLLPPGVELSGYRIVEHLLVALENDPAGTIDVRLTFGADALQLTVAGPTSRHANARAALAAATERAATHGGTLRTQAGGGRREIVVLLPLAGGHA